MLALRAKNCTTVQNDTDTMAVQHSLLIPISYLPTQFSLQLFESAQHRGAKLLWRLGIRQSEPQPLGLLRFRERVTHRYFFGEGNGDR